MITKQKSQSDPQLVARGRGPLGLDPFASHRFHTPTVSMVQVCVCLISYHLDQIKILERTGSLNDFQFLLRLSDDRETPLYNTGGFHQDNSPTLPIIKADKMCIRRTSPQKVRLLGRSEASSCDL